MARTQESLYDDSWKLILRGNRLVQIKSSKLLANGWPTSGPVNRGVVTGFSPRSADRMRDYLLSCLCSYQVMVTLTVPTWSDLATEPFDVKAAFRGFMARVSRNYGSSSYFPPGFSLFWFQEFTKAGCLHIHFFCTHFLPKGFVSAAWYQSCGTGDSRHLNAGTRVEALRGGDRNQLAEYARKYATKYEQKILPEGITAAGRWWGIYGERKVVAAAITHSGQWPDNESPQMDLVRQFWIDIALQVSSKTSRLLEESPDFPGVSCLVMDEFSSLLAVQRLMRRLDVQLLHLDGSPMSYGEEWFDDEGSMECL